MGRTTALVRLTLASFVPLLLAAPATGQTISARGATIRVGGRLHSQYSTSSVGGASEDFFIKRARLIADVTVNDFYAARVQTDFAGGEAELKDVYVRLDVAPALRLTMGQFKRAFDVFQLSSSTDLSLIERDGRVEGVDACSGVGGTCSFDRLTERLQFSDRDQGLRIDGSAGRFEYQTTVTNGTGANVSDENDAKSASGRVGFAVTDRLTVAGQVASHDYVTPEEETKRAFAWGGDVVYGTWRDGLHVQASVVGGDNWKALDAAGDEATFLTAQAVVTYYRPLTGGRFAGVEPLARISVADPDTDAPDDRGWVFTPGLMLYVLGKNKVGFNVDVFSPERGDTEVSFKIQSFLYF